MKDTKIDSTEIIDLGTTGTTSTEMMHEEKSRRNRNRVLLGLGVALVAVAAILFSGTLARYITEATGTDTARVARWGVTVDAINGDGLFSTEYATHDSSYGGALSVVSSNSDRVVAPGTSGSLGGFSITGTPEVATRISVAVDSASGLTGWLDADANAYEPILWTLTDGEGTVVVNEGSFAQLETALNNIEIDAAAGTDLSDSDLDYTISWEWPFSTGAANDLRDTFLADQSPAPTVTLAFTVTVAQID